MTLDEVRRINDRRLARQGQRYYVEDKVYVGNSDGSLSLIVRDVQNQYNPTAGSGISISGTFPNQTISNTLPDQTVALTAGTGISVAGTYPSFTITNTAAGYSILRGVTTGIDTYTTTITGVTSYVDGDAYLIRFTNGNTVASPTLNINGIGAIPLYRNNDGQLIGGDIVDGAEMLCVYNSTLNAFQCIGTSPNTLFAYVTNGDSVSITRGQPVYAFSGTGDRMVVKLANNTSDATSARTVGLVYSTSIGVNQKGLIITEGLLDGLTIVPPSSGWADGDIVYLGATAGTITRTKPYAPNHLVYLGVVTTASNGSAGRIQVTVQNGYELNEIHDVDVVSTPAVNNDVLTYVTGPPNLWKPRSIGTILGYTPVPTTRTLTINGSAQDLSADRTWNVGTVTSVSGTGTVSGLSLSGTVTGSGNITLGGTLALTSGDITTGLGYTPYNATNPAGYITSATAAATYVELAGDTMTGQLNFSGTTHAGIRLNNLTTAQRVALTPTSGMLVLDTDLDEFCHYNGAGWEYELNKSVTSVVTTNTTGAANITGLSFPVEANSLFLIEGYYSVACSGNGGIKFTQTTPALSVMDVLYDGIAGTATTSVKIRSLASGTLTATAINSAITNSGVIVRGYVRTTTNAGTLQMQFASNTNGQTSTIAVNSWVKITRLS
jgi:hypothetical protein